MVILCFFLYPQKTILNRFLKQNVHHKGQLIQGLYKFNINIEQFIQILPPCFVQKLTKY